MSEEFRLTVDTIWRMESGRIVAGLVRLVRDLGRAEELAQDAFIAALEQWPASGIPANPGAWLMTTARRRAVDQIRRNVVAARKYELVAHDLRAQQMDATDFEVDVDADPIGDERLSLIFAACHPVLPAESRVALTLRLLGGLTTDEIARAFLVPEPTMAQRIVRAKKTLANANVPFEVPSGPDRLERLSSVLEVIYLIFNEGYGASSGESWIRTTLTDEALRLARVVAELSEGEGEAHGLVALLELQASRFRARVDSAGKAVRLADQSRAAWDQLLIRRGLASLDRARALTASPGPYQLQAEIAACHARAAAADETDWRRIAELYASLAVVAPSPVVELNRAVAVSMADGPAAALALVDALVTDGTLANYHLVPAVRGDLLERLGRHDEARSAFEQAAAMTANSAERELLEARARRSSTGAGVPSGRP